MLPTSIEGLAPPQDVHIPNSDLTRLLRRLEAATSRLEDIASSAGGLNTGPTVNGTKPGTTLNSEASIGRTDSITPKGQPAPALELPDTVQAFDVLLKEDVQMYMDRANALDDVIAEQASAVLRAFQAQRQFLLITTRSKKPDPAKPIYLEMLKDLQHELGMVGEIREANRSSPLKEHLAMVGEGIGALAWVGIDHKPGDYIAEILSGAQFYGNRVLKEYKEKDRAHVEYVQAFYKLIQSLSFYTKKHYPIGLVWNNKEGLEPEQALKQDTSGPISTSSGQARGAPPPPPPPPLPSFEGPQQSAAESTAKGSAAQGEMGAVFDQLNRGEAVTSGLRKVDKREMTHKNPSLRASAPQPTRSNSSSTAGRGKSPTPPRKPETMRTKKPPRKELDGNKWIIENFEEEQQPIEIEASIQQSILISRCTKTTIRVLGKANAISLDNCSRTSLIVDSLVSSIDAIKSPNFAVQVIGTLPTLMLDQVDGATVYLSKQSLGTEIFTSKCTSVNINLPPTRDEDDYKECPVPEQIRSFVKNGQVISEIVEHAG